MGLCYLDGEVVEEDEDEAVNVFCIAAEGDYSDAQVQLGKCFITGRGMERNFDEAVRLFRKAIENGTVTGYLSLECASKYSWVWSKIGKKLFGSSNELQTREMTMGNANLGIAIGRVGIEKDLEKAANISRSAARKGCWDACMHLGSCYKLGLGVEKNVEKAYRLFELSAENNRNLGIVNLGIMYAYGDGIEQNQAEAVRLFQIAAKRGCG